MTNTMRNALKQRIGYGMLPALLIFTLAACDTTNAMRDDEPASPSLAASIDAMAQNLELSPDAVADVKAAFANHEDKAGTPGHLWYVAADLQETLTPEQKEQLFARLTQQKERRAEASRMKGQRGKQQRARRHMKLRNPGRAAEALGLTDTQQEAMKTIRENYSPQFKALKQAREDGTKAPETVRAEMKTLREAMREETNAILTDEQRTLIEAKKAERKDKRQERRAASQERRAESRTIATEVLGLTEEQQQTLRALAETQRSGARALREEVRAGQTNRDDAGAVFRTLREARTETLSATLTPAQLETVKIHRALSHQLMRRKLKEKRARRG